MPGTFNDVPADTEREIAAEVAQKAMVAGWDRAILDVGKAKGLPQLVIENILNKVSKDQASRDPSARIDELADWELQKSRTRSNLIRTPGGSNLHKLSPGLQAYMRKKHPHLDAHKA